MNNRERLLLVDDDPTFCRVLGKAMERRGFTVDLAHTVDTALAVAGDAVPDCAVLDLSMPGPSGLTLIPRLKGLNPSIRIVVLTGYASISTTVEAMKLGATHYLAKPADADEVVAAFGRGEGDAATPVRRQAPSLKRLEWEHIQKVLAENDGNVSATARALGMHLRTLQRKLRKHPVRR